MALYRQIVAEHAQDRPVAAKALLRLGGCYEKLGRGEARKAYQQLISDYSDQTAEVTAARQKLAGLALASVARPSEPVFQKVTIPGKVSPGARISSDGARLAMVSESDGEVWVVTLQGRVATDIAGVPQRLSRGAKAFWDGLTWSGNGQWVAANVGEYPPRDIAVLPASGGALRKLSRPAAVLSGRAWGLALAPDGRHLAYSIEADGRNVLQVVSIESGETAARLGNPEATEPVFSPDGAHLAYVRMRERDSLEVRVVRLADRTDVQVAEATKTTRSPAWSPDGRLVAFLVNPDDADRLWHNDLWIVPAIEAGGTAGKPTKIALPKWAYRIAGWTADGRIALLCVSPLHGAVYTVPLSGGRATQVTQDSEGVPTSPQWSPDGERIYVRWMLGDVASVPAGGGKVSVVAQRGERVTEGMPVGGNHISPDGKRIVFAGARVGGASPIVHLWTMPVTGGEPVQLMMKPDRHAFQPRWSPDGRWIAFHSQTESAERKLDENIFIISSEGGEPRQLTSHSDCRCALPAWSPGGDSIAYACSDKTIRVVPIRGGEPRTVLNVEDPTTVETRFDFRGGSLAWTPDGARLLYAAKGRVWTVAAAGGEPTAISTDVDGDIQQFALSPDGKTIAFNVLSGGDMELWLMGNFMHLVKATR